MPSSIKRRGEEESCHLGENDHEGRMVSGCSLASQPGLAVPPSRIERQTRQEPIKTQDKSLSRHKTPIKTQDSYQDTRRAYQDTRRLSRLKTQDKSLSSHKTKAYQVTRQKPIKTQDKRNVKTKNIPRFGQQQVYHIHTALVPLFAFCRTMLVYM